MENRTLILKHVTILIRILFCILLLSLSGCKTSKISFNEIKCPHYDTIFPINETNYKNFLDFKKYGSIVNKTENNIHTIEGSINVGPVKISLKESSNSSIASLNYKMLGQFDSINSVYRSYKIQNDTISDFYTLQIYNDNSFYIGKSRVISYEGYVDRENGYNICWKQALAIAETNMLKYREKKQSKRIQMTRSEYYNEPLWIFTIFINDKQEYYSVDGKTGQFRKAKYKEVYPAAH
jgi:hypothetical protein